MVLSFIGASGGTETVPRMMHIACDGAWEKDAMLAKILFAWCLVATTVFFSRCRPGDRFESSAALDCAAGDAVLAYDVASGSDHLVAHCYSRG
jgi:hypothetical protein